VFRTKSLRTRKPSVSPRLVASSITGWVVRSRVGGTGTMASISGDHLRMNSAATPTRGVKAALLRLYLSLYSNSPISVAVSRLLWKIEKAYSLGIPKQLAPAKSQTEEEHAYARNYTIFWSNGRSFWT
jgi:hypothetical protein